MIVILISLIIKIIYMESSKFTQYKITALQNVESILLDIRKHGPFTEPYVGTKTGTKMANAGRTIGRVNPQSGDKYRWDYDPTYGLHLNFESADKTLETKFNHRQVMNSDPKWEGSEFETSSEAREAHGATFYKDFPTATYGQTMKYILWNSDL